MSMSCGGPLADESSSSAFPWPDGRLYGRRQAKPLRPRPQRLVTDLLPTLAVTPDHVGALIAAWEGRVWLEVGFGGGEHLAWQAARHPDTLMLGAEPFLNGVGKLLGLIEDQGLTNIRILHGDVRPLMAALPDQSVDRLFVLHPDPWPKKKHHKRRMISPAFLDQAARILPPGGHLRVSSDIPDYVRWTLMHIQRHNRREMTFRWTARRRRDWTVRPEDWPQTRYEAKALREGRSPAYLDFIRQPDGHPARG